MNFGVIGFGRIARKFVKSIENTKEGKIYAIGSKSVSSKDQYIKTHPDVLIYHDYQELLNDTQVDAVYIALPHQMHKEWIIKALEQHIPVLSEKPIVLTSHDIEDIMKIAHKNQTYCVEALKTKFNQGYIELQKDINTIGNIKRIEASFCFDATALKGQSYLFEKGEGGAINDVGSYLIGFIQGILQDKIVKIETQMKIIDEIDYSFFTQMTSEKGCQINLEGSIDQNKERVAFIEGQNGSIEIPMFNRIEEYTMTINNRRIRKEFPILGDDMTYEISSFIHDVKNKQIQSSLHSLGDSKEMLEIQEQIKRSL